MKGIESYGLKSDVYQQNHSFWKRYGHILWKGCLLTYAKKSAMVVNLGMVVYLLLWIPVPWSLIYLWSSIWHLRVHANEKWADAWPKGQWYLRMDFIFTFFRRTIYTQSNLKWNEWYTI